MSEFAPTIASPANAGTTSINTGMPQMGAENASGFSSKSLGMFKDIRSDSSQGIVDIQNGIGPDAEFQRSESFEAQVQDSRSLFDVSNPYVEEQLDGINLPTPGIENAVTNQPIEGPVQAPIDKNKEFTDMLANSVVLWERPDSKLKAPSADTITKTAESPTILEESAEHTIQPETPVAQPEAEASTETSTDVAVAPEIHAQTDSEIHVESNEGSNAEALLQSEAETDTQEATGSITITQTETEAENTPAVPPQLETAQNIEAKTTVTALEAVREEVRLMPDTDEVTITLAQPLTELKTKTMPEVMDMESLQELLQTQEVQEVETKTMQTEPTTNANGEIVMAGEKPTDVPEDDTKITIKKAWFEKDVNANQNRKIEIIKAYALVHYEWLRQYIGSVEGSQVADVIKKHRDREKLESMSIKAIEKDGSVDPFATTIERVQEIEAPEELETILEEAEEQFSATNFTSSPTKEIVDGEQIDYVHNGQDIFNANLDGEEVKVIMNGAKTAKKPEFIKVEIE